MRHTRIVAVERSCGTETNGFTRFSARSLPLTVIPTGRREIRRFLCKVCWACDTNPVDVASS